MSGTDEVDTVLLAVGLLRVIVRMFGVYFGLKIRKVLPRAGTIIAVGFTGTVINTGAFALLNANVVDNDLLFHIAVLTSLPSICLIVTGFALVTSFLLRLRTDASYGSTDGNG